MHHPPRRALLLAGALTPAAVIKVLRVQNIIAYRINPDWKKTTAQIEAGLSLTRFMKCGATQEKSIGWSEPRNEAHAVLAEVVNGHLILRLTSETTGAAGQRGAPRRRGTHRKAGRPDGPQARARRET